MRLQAIAKTASLLLPLSVLAAAPAQAQEKKLSAREIFYTPPPERAERSQTPPASRRKEQKAPPVDRRSPSGRSGGVGAEYVPAALPAGASIPLGIRYSVLKRTEGGSVETDSGTVFRAGDRIRLRVEVNDDGYLYVINRGTSGVWKPLFPSPEIEGGDNRVTRGREYEIPARYVFTFDEQPGEERLFIVFSRQAEDDLEQLIYSLSKKERTGPQHEKSDKPQKYLIAQNLEIKDAVVERMRNVYARDLVIEKVDEAAPGPRKEKAVYVVNTSGAPDSHVVADLTLTHR